MISTLRLGAVIISSFAMLMLASCAKDPKVEEDVTVLETPDGAAIVETYTLTATITGIDPVTRKLTLTTPDGAKIIAKAAKSTPLSDFKIGERVTATLAEELAVFLTKAGGVVGAGEAATVAVATAGANSAVFMADTVSMTAEVTKVDAKTRKVTFLLPDGKSKTVKAGKNVNLANIQPGDDVTVRVTEAFALDLDKN